MINKSFKYLKTIVFNFNINRIGKIFIFDTSYKTFENIFFLYKLIKCKR